jgi:hypothetical protein
MDDGISVLPANSILIFQQHWTSGRVVDISDWVSSLLSMIAGNAITVMVHWSLVKDEESDVGARRVGTADELKIFGRPGTAILA